MSRLLSPPPTYCMLSTDDITESEDASDDSKDDMDDVVCGKCKDGGDEDHLLLCEHCPVAFHIYCLVPALERVPDGDWVCDTCLAKQQTAKGNSKGVKPNKHKAAAAPAVAAGAASLMRNAFTKGRI